MGVSEPGGDHAPDAHADHAPARVPGPPPGPLGRPLFTRLSLLALVMVGGAVGTLLRSLLETAHRAAPGTWPWTTFGINLAGSFILALLLTALTRSGPDVGWRRHARLGAGTGFCGGFTTYSTFVVEVDTLLRDGWVRTGLAYALVSVVVGIAAAVLGVIAARRWPRPPAPVVP